MQKISFRNYKAFEKGEIKLKPITILLGANSVGKSSIINLLLMLQQTASSTNYKSVLRLHGESVSMGECENIFRNKDTSKNIIIDYEFKNENLKDFLKKEIFDYFINIIIQPIQFVSRFPEIIKDQGKIGLNQFINEIGKVDNKVYYTKDFFLRLVATLDNLNKHRLSGELQNYLKRYREQVLDNKQSLGQLWDFLFEAKKIRDDIFSLSFELYHVKINKEDVLKMSSVSFRNNENVILNIKFKSNTNNSAYNHIAITSEFTEQKDILDDKTRKEFLSLINYNSTIFSWIPRYNRRDFFFSSFDDEENSIITKILLEIIKRAFLSIQKQFSRELINHVSPLRAHPKRYYFLDKANINTILDTLDGNSLTEILKENNIVKDKVNNWLKTFGLQVNVSTLQDIIHKLRIHQHTLDLDITDVGFGISQILPIIVQGFSSFDGSLTMIEQPEIHLHPKMQADLADLFIDVVMGVSHQRHAFMKKPLPTPKKYLLIETHSEYLLRRLRRRISEGKILARDVAIYFITPPKDENSSAEIQEKEISEDGVFDWPQDFYEGELKEDTTIFLKRILRSKK